MDMKVILPTIVLLGLLTGFASHSNGQGVLNDPQAQNAMGVNYEQGDGVPKDLEQAVKWYRLSAEGGNHKGQFNLGRCYSQGNGVEKNPGEALLEALLMDDQVSCPGKEGRQADHPEERG